MKTDKNKGLLLNNTDSVSISLAMANLFKGHDVKELLNNDNPYYLSFKKIKNNGKV